MYRDIVRNHISVFVALILGVVTLGVVFVVSRDSSVQDVVTKPAFASPATDAVSKKLAQKDSDGDGLFDWEEQLWGTDPFKIDSDGDGVLDGEEVNKRIQQNKNSDNALALQENEPLTRTAEFSQDFFSQYLKLRADGNLTPEESGRILALGLSDVSFSLPKPLSTESIIVIDSVSPNILGKYFDTVANIINDNTPDDIGAGEARLLQKALQEQDDTPLIAVRNIANGYRLFTKEFEVMEVPKIFLSAHIELLNATNQMSFIIGVFGNAFNDPINALSAIPAYKESSLKLLAGFRALTASAKEIGYSPKTSSAGYEVYTLGL